MDKKTFINELEESLSVLQEDELDDIINEYEQHIDMKMKSGLTEDEAIADFGSLPELTADILEAYHVRADYVAGQKKNRKPFFGDDKAAGKEILQQTRKSCKEAGGKAAYGLRRIGRWLWGVLLFAGRQLGRPVAFLKEMWEKRSSRNTFEGPGGPAAPEKAGQGTLGFSVPADRRHDAGAASKGRNAMGSAVCGIWHFACAGVRMGLKLVFFAFCVAWNSCCIGFSLFCAGIGLFCLYILGMLAVLLVQDYPLAGVTIGCLGLVMCMFAAAGLGITLLWGKKRRSPERMDKTLHKDRRMDGREEMEVSKDNGPTIQYREMEGGQHA